MRLLMLVFAAALALTSAGCTPGQRGAMADVLRGISDGTAWLASAIDVGETGARVYFARHPSLESESKVSSALLAAREAQSALAAIVASGLALNSAEFEQARGAALDAYSLLFGLLDSLGVLTAKPAAGGADGAGPEPRPVAMPSPAEIGARL